MKLRDLKAILDRIDGDAEVEDGFGDEIIDVRIVCDTRRRVQFLTEADDNDNEADEYDDRKGDRGINPEHV